jgi:hypothetical protein
MKGLPLLPDYLLTVSKPETVVVGETPLFHLLIGRARLAESQFAQTWLQH